MRRSIIALAAGLLLLAGAATLAIAWQHEHAAPKRTPTVEIDDGMLYRDVQPWVDPSPPFPLTCVNVAYCQFPGDPLCTIIYVMLDMGTAEDDIRAALVPQHDVIHEEDFADCRGFEHYWSGTDSV